MSSDKTSGLVPANPADLRHMAWEPQLASKTVRTNYCMEYPIVATRAGVKLAGQAVAIGANAAAFAFGARVTYNVDSDICLEPALPVAGDVGDAAGIVKALAAIDTRQRRCVGQVVKRNERSPTSYLDKVRSRWESTTKGFEDLDRMPGSATGGKPWHLHTAGASDSIVISLFMR